MSSPETKDPQTALCLGIDTGGTYTDAVLWSQAGGVLAKAKALTTRHDLSQGIAGAVDAVMQNAGIAPQTVSLVSMSTTLATNALVEHQGGRVGLVMIGFAASDLERDGLKSALGSDPFVLLQGGHDVYGEERPLDLSPLENVLPEWAGAVSAVATCSYFATRNPAHEHAARELVRNRTGLPVTVSHELSARLGGPRRALTTLFNARLVSLIDRLIEATQTSLAERSIAAPLMVVRGDGALVSAGFARLRPIETILSGPAASLVGARYLTGAARAIVSDIGGTTTDIAILEDGRPRLDPEGAAVGGWRTMVEAVAMRTHGLGGDSEVDLADDGSGGAIKLGPRRLVPLCLAASNDRQAVITALERQALQSNPGKLTGRLAFRTGMQDRFSHGLNSNEARLYAAITDRPQALTDLLTSSTQNAALARLVARGLVHLAGFTPSDAAHVLGRQSGWDREAARLGAELFAARKDRRGQMIADSAKAVCETVLAAVTRRSAELMLESAFAEDGHDGPAITAHPLIQRALDGDRRIARVSVHLDRPVIGLGASARLHYERLGALVGNECLIPDHADVANALGAVVGQVRVSVEASISQPVEGVFRVSSPGGIADFSDEADALAAAQAMVQSLAANAAIEAGAAESEIAFLREVEAPEVDGKRTFIAARLVATASGRPTIAG